MMLNNRDYNLERWYEKFNELKAFYLKHKHVNLPARYKENPPLATWIVRQRLNKHLLSIDQKKALDSIHFIWNPRQQLWEENYQKLKEFYQIHGHCNVPISYKSDPAFGRWVRKQRAVEPELSLERIERLNALQFSWKLRDDIWIEHYYNLKKYIETHHNLPRYNTEYRLYNWVKRQRYKHQNMQLKEDQVEMLKKLGIHLN